MHAGVRTALVVENDSKSTDLIHVQLAAEGFTVLHSASAEAALVIAAAQLHRQADALPRIPRGDCYGFGLIVRSRANRPSLMAVTMRGASAAASRPVNIW